MSTTFMPSRRLTAVIKPSFRPQVCQSCRRELLRRNHASAAAAAVEHSPLTSSDGLEPAPSPQPVWNVRAGILLSRAPLITRDLTPFEKAFFFYQKRLNERLSLPFTRYFYYKRGTPAYLNWKEKLEERLTPAHDIGKYNAYSKEAWNDELLVGATESEPEAQMEAMFQDVPQGTKGDGSDKDLMARPKPRVTQADLEGDVKSLNRLLQRTLYLLVQKNGHWEFPSGMLEGRESLREGAERILAVAAGINMNTWFVGHAPVGQVVHETRKQAGSEKIEDRETLQPQGDKTFFMKARIMAGQAELKDNPFELSDFKWLAKEEIQPLVHPRYWSCVQNMLADR